MKYPYDVKYQPPFPAIQVAFYNEAEGLRTDPESALVDTGSDGTLVPLIYLQQILAPAISETHISSHWGEWRPVQLFVVDLELANLKLPSVFVVGDEQGDEIILGRNILNKLSLLLNGPDNLTDILES